MRSSALYLRNDDGRCVDFFQIDAFQQRNVWPIAAATKEQNTVLDIYMSFIIRYYRSNKIHLLASIHNISARE